MVGELTHTSRPKKPKGKYCKNSIKTLKMVHVKKERMNQDKEDMHQVGRVSG